MSSTSETTQVLEFSLGEQRYCIAIEHVTEIIDGGKMTSVPSTDDCVEGLMDLRGQTTTIVNPYMILETNDVDPTELVTDGGVTQNRIIMLEEEISNGDGAIAWLVSDVSEVTEVQTDALEAEGITDSNLFRGVVKNDDDDGFTIWLDPQELNM